ncbi:MAG: recombinase family protein [Patescibacteria group bacterium]|nr:recombinase family protein [Patescibacteria group bacterium]
MDEEIDFTKLKYVLYARKSTDDPQRQVRSIGDQIFECKQLAARIGINIVKVLEETKSAKKPNQRSVFRQMLNDLKKGTYDGILAWNPDRLARNMKEGGEIIDMIDEEEIKDLKFVTHHFTKDANGKILLGMSFVLSKQYSDDLSQKVTRGVRRNFAEGKSSIPKHGYIRTEKGYYKPDGKNFELISTAWELRSKGESLEDITKFMNDNDYSKTIKRTGRKIDMDIKILTDILHDPFYYGILVQAKQTVDLREIYNFEPVIQTDWTVKSRVGLAKKKIGYFS